MPIVIKHCVDCGEEFLDMSMFGQLRRCDSCSMKHGTGMWTKTYEINHEQAPLRRVEEEQ